MWWKMHEGRVRHDLIGPGAVNAAHKAHINILYSITARLYIIIVLGSVEYVYNIAI